MSTQKDKKKRAVFSIEEIEILIQLWGDSGIQKKFASSVRHNVIWEEIASQMKEFGFDRNFTEIKSKINNLKTEYRKLKPSSGSSTPDWPFFKAMHSVLGQRDVERDDLVEDSFSNYEEQIPLEIITEETECFFSPTKRPRLVDNPRMSTVDRPGTSGTQGTQNKDTEAEVSENEDSQGLRSVSAEEQIQPTPSSFKRIPRPSQRKERKVHQILSFLKTSEEKQSQQLDAQNQLLQHLIEQEEAANERDDRVAEAFINTLNIMSKTLIKQDKRHETSSSFRAPSMSPPLRLASPTPLRSAFSPAQNNVNNPRILYVSAASPLYRSPSTQSLPSPDPSDPGENK